MDGCMDEWLNQWLWLRLFLWLHVNIAAYTAYTEATNSTGTAESTLAATAVTATYICIVTQVKIYFEIKPDRSGNLSGSALGHRLYFTVYPSSCHNTDSV